MLAMAPIAFTAYMQMTVWGMFGMQMVTVSPSLIPIALNDFSACLICGTSFSYVVCFPSKERATCFGYLRALSKRASLIEKSGYSRWNGTSP